MKQVPSDFPSGSHVGEELFGRRLNLQTDKTPGGNQAHEA